MSSENTITLSLDELRRRHPEESLPATSPECAPRYWAAAEIGEGIAADADVTILGLCRNSMPWIALNAQRVEALGSRFKSWRAFVYENDSVDGTDECLRNWEKHCDHVRVLCVKHDRPQLNTEKSARRTHALAEYRQHCLEWAAQHRATHERQYVIVIDLDAWGGWSDTGVMNGLHWLDARKDAAGMASISTVEMPHKDSPDGVLRIHYDAWAFRMNHWTEHDMAWFPVWFPPVGSEPVPCRSAFGGLCVYKADAFFAGRYTGGDCEHVPFHRSIYEATGLRMYLNPSQRIVMNWLRHGRQHDNNLRPDVPG